MPIVNVEKIIRAPLELVFRTVAHIEEFSQVIPHITHVEFLTEQKTGVGTRFVETRLMKGKEHQTDLEVVEYEPNQKVRIVTESHGTTWDTLFQTDDLGDGTTRLTMMMESTPHTLMQKLMLPLVNGMIARAVEADMDAVQQWCEEQSPQ